MGSPTVSIILAVAPKFTALLSLLGSLGILIKVLHDERLRSKPAHRIVAGLSVSDLMVTIWYFAGSWVIPAGTLSWFGDGKNETVFWAAGSSNNVGCELGGFFNQYGVASPLYNGTLAWYYLLVIYFGWKDTRIAKIEYLFHVIPCGYATLTSIFAITTDLYGHVEWTCWILPDLEEDEDRNFAQKHFKWIQWIFLFGVVWACVIWQTIVFVMLYIKMKEIEKKLSKYGASSFIVASKENKKAREKILADNVDQTLVDSEEGATMLDAGNNARKTSVQFSSGSYNSNQSLEVDSEEGATRKKSRFSIRPSVQFSSLIGSKNSRDRKSFDEDSRSRKVAIQGMLFVAAFYITWLFPTLNRITELAGKKNVVIHTIDAILLPLQGFLNFWIFMTPRLQIYRKKYPDEGFWSSLKSVVFGTDD